MLVIKFFLVYTETLGVDLVSNVTLDLVCRISNLQLADRVGLFGQTLNR